MSKLESWVTTNWLTQGYSLHFEDLSIYQLDVLSDLVIAERLNKINQKAEQRQIEEELEAAEKVVSKLKEKLEKS